MLLNKSRPSYQFIYGKPRKLKFKCSFQFASFKAMLP